MPFSEALRHWRTPLIVLLTTVALFAATEWTLRLVMEWLPPIETMAHIREKTSAVAAPASYDILFFGDSTAITGLHPSIVREATGLRAYNFAISQHVSSFADVVLLRRYLAIHPPPLAAVVSVGFASLSLPLETSIYREFFEDPDLDPILRPLEPKWWNDIDAFIGVFFPSYASKDRILVGLSMLRRGERPESYDAGAVTKTGRLTNLTGDDQQILNRVIDSGPGGIHSERIALLQRFCADADRSGIPVLLKLSPIVRNVASYRDLSGYVVLAVYRMREALSAYPSCTVSEDIELYGGEAMQDLIHVNRTGAVLFTRQVIRELRERGAIPASGT